MLQENKNDICDLTSHSSAVYFIISSRLKQQLRYKFTCKIYRVPPECQLPANNDKQPVISLHA
jgi:hypothetical protein